MTKPNPHRGFATAYVHLLPYIVETARERGYAIATHGSFARDMDLIAVPWTAEAVEAEALVEAIRERLNGDIPTEAPFENPATKLHGRRAWSIYLLKYGPAYIDLSVMPLVKEPDRGDE